MRKLTATQKNQLQNYSIYVETPPHVLFSFSDLLESAQPKTLIGLVKDVSGCPNFAVSSSFFTRRFGMFISMQLYFLATEHCIWRGDTQNLLFGARKEFGMPTVSTFVAEEDWVDVSEENREDILRFILQKQCQPLIQQLRNVSNLSSLTHWENIFGFLLWHYHVLLETPEMMRQATIDLELLSQDTLWKGIADESLFARYLQHKSPSQLLNTTVRTTCCFSKDVPGLMQCGFCPLKK